MTGGVRKHTCKYCAKSYLKAEHLLRHERSHTGDKPFVCPDCGRRFTRLDSLHRHQQRQDHSGDRRPSLISIDDANDNDASQAASAGGTSDTYVPGVQSNISAVLGAPPTPAGQITEPIVEPQGLQPSFAQAENQESFMQLTWPDSEALLQSILNYNLSSWPQNFEALPSQYLFDDQIQSRAEHESPWLPSNADQASGNGVHAIRNISQILSEVTTNLTSEAESTALSTVFLEACLHVFFEQFTSSFPICHRPTFVFRDWTHPLLLNAIALGSLFIGHEINIAKGEVLWTLAHTAVATSWHSFIDYRGPYDACRGVQLILTALLGQTYAMLSGTAKLRSTAQIFHSLGFYWAQQCDMYSNRHRLDLTELWTNVSEERRIQIWRYWAAEEAQLRALLGHYILDGLLTYFTGAPTCQRHAANPLPLPCSKELFEAGDANLWVRILGKEPPKRMKFRQLFLDIFENPADAFSSTPELPLLAVQVIMEGVQSFVTDSNIADGHMVGSPPEASIRAALYALRTYIKSSKHFSHGEKAQLLLRWHAVCIDLAISFNRLAKKLCSHFNVEQAVFKKVEMHTEMTNLREWTKNPQTRRALLHSVAIWEISKDLPIGQMHAVHVPISVFVAAVVYCAFVLGGTSSIQVPSAHDWRLVMIDSFNERSNHDLDEQTSQLLNFVANRPTGSKMTSRNLLYDANAFALLLRQLRRPWVICGNFEDILQQLLSKCGI